MAHQRQIINLLHSLVFWVEPIIRMHLAYGRALQNRELNNGEPECLRETIELPFP